MENIKNRIIVLSKAPRIVYSGILAVYLIMMGINANGQISQPGVRCAYPPLAPRPNGLGLGLGGAEVLGGQIHQHPLPAITTIMRCAYPPRAGAGGGSASSSKQNLVTKIYTSQIGVRETQPNSGKQVEKYLRYVNLPKGNPWCAAFVCWVFGEANVDNPRSAWSPVLFGERYVIWKRRGESFTRVESGKLKAESVHRYAYSQQLLHPGESTRLIYAPTQTSDFRPPTSAPLPQAGDIFGLFFPEKGRISHVGFVDEWNDPWVTTVEGNTNVLGSREGDGVYRKRRLIASIYKVARYVN